MILAGDVGGTKVNLDLFEKKNGILNRVEEVRFASRDYSGLESILDEFFTQVKPRVERACFGIAGPVKDGKCEVTNLPWVVEVRNLRQRLGLDAVWLINDLAATACSVPFLEPGEFEVLQAGSETALDRVAVIAAGTGLGEAFLTPDDSERYCILDSEGGHCDFAPRNEMESRLLLFLLKKFDRVSIERVLSGPGLVNLYEFFKEDQALREPDWLAREFQEEDPGVVVTRNGLDQKSPACEQALKLFVTIYGAVAGNLALQFLAAGGIYLGGGIAPKILSVIKEGLFMEAFLAKGRFESYLTQVPVKVILNERAALLGAAHYALGEKFERP